MDFRRDGRCVPARIRHDLDLYRKRLNLLQFPRAHLGTGAKKAGTIRLANNENPSQN
jgi:hypothetical protein